MENCTWQQKASAWLREKADKQEATNQENPRHAELYESWRQRPALLRMLALEVEAAP